MNEPTVIDFTVAALKLVLILSMPPIIVASFVGLLVSLVQALTQVQEQTISFAVKLVAVILTLLLAGRWMASEIYSFSLRLFELFPFMIQ